MTSSILQFRDMDSFRHTKVNKEDFLKIKIEIEPEESWASFWKRQFREKNV